MFQLFNPHKTQDRTLWRRVKPGAIQTLQNLNGLTRIATVLLSSNFQQRDHVLLAQNVDASFLNSLVWVQNNFMGQHRHSASIKELDLHCREPNHDLLLSWQMHWPLFSSTKRHGPISASRTTSIQISALNCWTQRRLGRVPQSQVQNDSAFLLRTDQEENTSETAFVFLKHLLVSDELLISFISGWETTPLLNCPKTST